MIAENHSIFYGKKEIAFSLLRRRRKTLEIGVCPNMAVEVIAPLNSELDAIKTKVRKRAGWICKQLRYFEQFQPTTPERTFLSGETHLYLGRQYRLKVVRHIQQRVKLIGGHIVVQTFNPMSPDMTRELVTAWYSEKAKSRFLERLEMCFPPFAHLGYPCPRLVIRKMARRWGSHTSTGNILLNPRLIQAPTECIDYVITHELCHLEHKDHSSKFYTLLETVMPDWKKRKLKLEKKLV